MLPTPVHNSTTVIAEKHAPEGLPFGGKQKAKGNQAIQLVVASAGYILRPMSFVTLREDLAPNANGIFPLWLASDVCNCNLRSKIRRTVCARNSF